jgi:hypothetical protein
MHGSSDEVSVFQNVFPLRNVGIPMQILRRFQHDSGAKQNTVVTLFEAAVLPSPSWRPVGNRAVMPYGVPAAPVRAWPVAGAKRAFGDAR